MKIYSENIILKLSLFIIFVFIASCATAATNTPSSAPVVSKDVQTLSILADDEPTSHQDNATWQQLQQLSSAKLTTMQAETADEVQRGWIDLALISKRNSNHTQQLVFALKDWRATHAEHPGNQIIPSEATLNKILMDATPQKIALLLPQTGAYARFAKNIRAGFLNAYYSDLTKVSNPSVKFYDTANVADINALHKKALADGADFVIGPLSKKNVQQLSGQTFDKPTLALNYESATNGNKPENLYEYGLLPEDEIVQMSHRASEAGFKRAIVIAPQNAWGKRLAKAFIARWHANHGVIADKWYFGARGEFNQQVAHLLKINVTKDKKLMHEQNNKEVLEQQLRQDFDVIFLFAHSQDARLIVPLLRYYYATDIPVFAISSVYSGDDAGDLARVIVCDIPAQKQVPGSVNKRLYAVGQDAYLLSQSLERLRLLPDFPIYGQTGALMLSSNQQIHRRIPCVAINNESRQ